MKNKFALIAALLSIFLLSSCATNEYRNMNTNQSNVGSNTVSKFKVLSVKMMDTPDSSCFSRIGYDSNYDKLVLVFRNSEDKYIYVYSDFSDQDWYDFKIQASLGGYYNKAIKNNYDCDRYDTNGNWQKSCQPE